MKTILTLMMTGCLAIALVTAQSRSAADQYQEALRLEEIKGDRTGAIEQYKKLAQGSDRAVAAKAQARLAALQSPAVGQAGLAVRLLWGDFRRVGSYGLGAPSADGRYLSSSQANNEPNSIGGDFVGILDLKTGKTISHNDPPDGSEVESSVVSPDGRQVAYERTSGNIPARCELRVVQISGGARSRLVHLREDSRCLQVHGWSPDGKSVVAVDWGRPPENNKIAIVSIADGSVRVLKDAVGSAGGATFSPDGRYVAYHARSRTGTNTKSDIFVVTADGRETGVVENPEADYSPMWSPDGSHLVFVSNRTGNPSLWMVPVVGGKPNGPATLVRANLGSFKEVLGMTRSGAVYYLAAGSGATNVYTAELDAKLNAGAAPSMATDVSVNSNRSGVWSPDGQFLAYSSDTTRGVVIRIRSAKTGEDREVPSQVPISGPAKWFPDGQSLLVASRDARLLNGNLGYYRVNIVSGQAELLHQTASRNIVSTRPDLTSDGKTIFYLDTPLQPVRFDIDSRRETRLSATGNSTLKPYQQHLSLAVSPDGAQIAYLGGQSLIVAPAAGGEPRELLRLSGYSPPRERADGLGLAWSPDQRHLFFVRPETGTVERVPLAGGPAENIGISMGRIRALRMHPDGRRITFDSVIDATSELWALEDFLPKARAAR